MVRSLTNLKATKTPIIKIEIAEINATICGGETVELLGILLLMDAPSFVMVTHNTSESLRTFPVPQSGT